MPRLYVSPLSAVESAIRDITPARLVSLLDPETMIETPAGFAPDRHLRLGVNDIDNYIDFLVPPDEAHVQQLVDFIAEWDLNEPMLVHCWAGISRSTAAAFVTLCLHNPQLEEKQLARFVRRKIVHARPNRLIVEIADDILKRKGRMVDALALMGPAEDTYEGCLVELPARPGAREMAQSNT